MKTPIPRQPDFDLSQTPLHWIPGDPFASDIISALHLMLPAGERAFCRAFRLALPQLQDDALIAQLRAFIRQEAAHARSHELAAQALLERHGVNGAPFTGFVEWLVGEGPLAQHPFGYRLPQAWQKYWLRFGIGVVASIEHSTCFIGQFLLDNRSWAHGGADPAMTALLKWHGAEEIEHRRVAYEVHRALGAGYLSRPLTLAFGLPMLLGLAVIGTIRILDQDPLLQHQRLRPWQLRFWRRWQRSARAGHLPSLSWMLRQQLRYAYPGYNPAREGNEAQALAYLSTFSQRHATSA